MRLELEIDYPNAFGLEGLPDLMLCIVAAAKKEASAASRTAGFPSQSTFPFRQRHQAADLLVGYRWMEQLLKPPILIQQ